MQEKYKNKIIKSIALVVGILLILQFILIFLNFQENKKTEIKKQSFVSLNNATLVRMKIPAIDADGKGVSTYLVVEAVPGTGRTLTDIENLLFWADTQQSIRMARLVANKYTNKSVNDYDLVYSIEANASIIGGPSAGAAIALATIFALNNENFREDVTITGTINHDGSIGPVSAILEKAKASKEANATVFLVPLLQSRDVVYETKEHCENFGPMRYCQTETIPRKISVSEEAGIKVVEVANIEEALKYFKV